MKNGQKATLGAVVAMVPGGIAVLAVGALAFFAGRAIVRSVTKGRDTRRSLANLGQAEAERLENAWRYPE